MAVFSILKGPEGKRTPEECANQMARASSIDQSPRQSPAGAGEQYTPEKGARQMNSPQEYQRAIQMKNAYQARYPFDLYCYIEEATPYLTDVEEIFFNETDFVRFTEWIKKTLFQHIRRCNYYEYKITTQKHISKEDKKWLEQLCEERGKYIVLLSEDYNIRYTNETRKRDLEKIIRKEELREKIYREYEKRRGE